MIRCLVFAENVIEMEIEILILSKREGGPWVIQRIYL